MPSSSQPVTARSAVKHGVSAERRVALERLFSRHMSSISATAVVRNAVSKAERRPEAGERELRRQLDLSIKMLVPVHARDEVTRALEGVLTAAPDADASSAGPTTPASAPAPASSTTPSSAKARGARAGSLASLASRLAGDADTSPKPEPRAARPYPEVSADTTVVLIRSEADMNATRGLARELCKLVGLMGYPAQKVVTAVSELARNIARYAGDGRVCFRVDADAHALLIVAEDHGPGIANLEEVLSGNYRSRTGLGRGLLGVRKLATSFEIETNELGTRVELSFAY